MFEKFNDTARRAIARSGDEARALSHPGIGTDHLLLALTYIADGEPNKAVNTLLALRVLPATVRDQALANMPMGAGPDRGKYLPFSPDLKRVLEFSLRASETVGDNHLGPEHLLAGLAQATESAAGKILTRRGITSEKVLDAIRQTNPELSPTAARTCDVYLPVGKSIFKNGAKVYPDLATAQAAHPGQEIAPFAFQLHEGEFFDVCTMYPKRSSWGKFATYPDAFAAAAELSNVPGAGVQIHIMVPTVEEIRGKDSRGHDVVLGRSVEYTSVRLMSRLLTEHPSAGNLANKEGARV